MTAFYVLGGITAAWAVLLAAVGIRRAGFPASARATRAVMAVSVTLFLASIGSAVVGGAVEGDEEEEAEAAAVEEVEAEEAETPGGAGGEPVPAGDAQEIQLSAVESGDLAFSTSELEAQSGSLTLTMENPSPIEHNVSLEGQGVDEEGEVVGQGGISTVTAEVRPGDYTFYCSVPGHREGGMEGTLTVE